MTIDLEPVLPVFLNSPRLIMQILSIPLQANNIVECETRRIFPPPKSRLAPGSLFAEFTRHNQVVVGLLLPNGIVYPLSKPSPQAVWFRMLRYRMRECLNMSLEGRIFRLAVEVTSGLNNRHSDMSDLTREARDVYSYLVSLIDELQTGLKGKNSESVLAGFYTWLTETSKATGMTQKKIGDLITDSLRGQVPTEIPDVSPELFNQRFHRVIRPA